MKELKSDMVAVTSFQDSAQPDDDFEAALIESRPRLFRTALLMVGSRSDAEDLTQRALLRALRGRTAFRRGSTVYTWLYRILVNLCKDLYKSRTRSARWFDEGGDSIDVASSESFEDELVKRERHGALRRALQELEPKAREVLVLRHYDEMSYGEIAEVLGCPVGTVRSRLSAARAKLRSALEPEMARGVRGQP